tara:strand:+ start:390 stop:1256 length:867 start_codon:yes stop_codon:yes gene_type:complete
MTTANNQVEQAQYQTISDGDRLRIACSADQHYNQYLHSAKNDTAHEEVTSKDFFNLANTPVIVQVDGNLFRCEASVYNMKFGRCLMFMQQDYCFDSIFLSADGQWRVQTLTMNRDFHFTLKTGERFHVSHAIDIRLNKSAIRRTVMFQSLQDAWELACFFADKELLSEMKHGAVCSQYSWVTSYFDCNVFHAYFLSEIGFESSTVEVNRVDTIIHITIHFAWQLPVRFLLTCTPKSWSYTYFQTHSQAAVSTIHTVSFYDEIIQQSLFALCFFNQIDAVRLVRAIMLV